jgi:hypothetical protein
LKYENTSSSTVLDRPSLLADWLSLLVLATAFFLYVAIHANAWFWWQIPVAASTLLWVLPAACVVVVQVWRVASERSALITGIVSIVLLVSVLSKIAISCLPFVTPESSRLSLEGTQLRVLYAPTHGGLEANEGAELAAQVEEGVDVVIGARDMLLGTPRLEEFRYRKEVSGADGTALMVVARYPIDPESITSFGDGTLPSVALKFRLTDESACWVALLSLRDSREPEDFQVNRVAVRRVATVFRNTDDPVVFVTDLRTPVFTKFYSILTRYLRLKNIFTGKGIVQGVSDHMFFVPWLEQHILVRRNLPIVQSQLIPVGNGNSFMLRLETRVPAADMVPDLETDVTY